MDNNNPYYLLVAGEPSGDRLGESLVRECVAHGIRCLGSGGPLMQAHGLRTLVPFYELGVSGFFDVLPRVLRLRKYLQTLMRALESPACQALICIDYPGFNLRLFKRATQLGKAVFWVAPPQIWAWKPQRGEQFRGQTVHVLFPFEVNAYKDYGAQVVRVAHPLLHCTQVSEMSQTKQPCLALLPGSRVAQAKRNLPLMRALVAKVVQHGEVVVILAPNAEVAEALHTKCLGLEVRNLAENPHAFADVRAAVCGPGTASLELALRAIPTIVVGRVDLLTYAMGRALLKVPHFALPNLLANERWIPEHLVPTLPWGPKEKRICVWAKEWNLQSLENAKARSTSLRAMLAGPSLCGEFAQFIQRNK